MKDFERIQTTDTPLVFFEMTFWDADGREYRTRRRRIFWGTNDRELQHREVKARAREAWMDALYDKGGKLPLLGEPG